MASSLEGIIRPFTTIDTTPRQGSVALPAPVPNVVLLVGPAGSGKIVGGSFHYDEQHYMDRVHHEKTSSDDEG